MVRRGGGVRGFKIANYFFPVYMEKHLSRFCNLSLNLAAEVVFNFMNY